MIEHERALARHPGLRELLAQQLPQPAPQQGKITFGSGTLVADEHVALAATGRPLRDPDSVEHQHIESPLGQEVGGRGPADAGADDDRVSRH
jgi:hypothetical protein